jgi:serine/threonine-protein kinase
LYQLLTGELPFARASFADTCTEVCLGRARPLRAARPDLPAELEPVILKCLAKRREDRHASAADLAAALAPYAYR